MLRVTNGLCIIQAKHPSVLFDDFLHNRQAKTRPLVPCGDLGFKQFGPILWKSYSIVADRNGHLCVLIRQ